MKIKTFGFFKGMIVKIFGVKIESTDKAETSYPYKVAIYSHKGVKHSFIV